MINNCVNFGGLSFNMDVALDMYAFDYLCYLQSGMPDNSCSNIIKQCVLFSASFDKDFMSFGDFYDNFEVNKRVGD